MSLFISFNSFLKASKRGSSSLSFCLLAAFLLLMMSSREAQENFPSIILPHLYAFVKESIPSGANIMSNGNGQPLI
jgi:hypothetical protein